MTKTTAEVNVGDRVLVEATVSNPEWHRATMLVDVGTTCNVKVNCSDVHSATDYASLQQRCVELTECVGRLVRIGNDMHSLTKCVMPDCAWVDAVYKAADLLGGEQG